MFFHHWIGYHTQACLFSCCLEQEQGALQMSEELIERKAAVEMSHAGVELAFTSCCIHKDIWTWLYLYLIISDQLLGFNISTLLLYVSHKAICVAAQYHARLKMSVKLHKVSLGHFKGCFRKKNRHLILRSVAQTMRVPKGITKSTLSQKTVVEFIQLHF